MYVLLIMSICIYCEYNLNIDTIRNYMISEKMEDKLKWVKNYERLQDIQGQLVWPSISDIDPRALIPDVSSQVKPLLNSRQIFFLNIHCLNDICLRHLIHGPLSLEL